MIPALLLCAVCATADPMADAPGNERAFAGRLRATLDARMGGASASDPDGTSVGVVDRRLEGTLAWAPSSSVLLSVGVPVLDRTLASNGETVDRASLGDVEARVQLEAWAERYASVRRRLVLLLGTKLPTAPLEADASGALLPSALQPGCSAIVPLLGVAYVASRAPWSWMASGTLLLPFVVRDAAPHSGDSLRASLVGQWQPSGWLGARGGAQGRLDGGGLLADGASDPSSGGFVGYVSADALVRPAMDLVLSLGGMVPVVQAWRGEHHEGPILAASAAYDF
ncbi:MAG TPA: hypothetical protein VIJ22_16400 [Polyangiaceae bacterium]